MKRLIKEEKTNPGFVVCPGCGNLVSPNDIRDTNGYIGCKNCFS